MITVISEGMISSNSSHAILKEEKIPPGKEPISQHRKGRNLKEPLKEEIPEWKEQVVMVVEMEIMVVATEMAEEEDFKLKY
jgi:hypothetical protein